jgi:alpha-glucosidase
VRSPDGNGHGRADRSTWWRDAVGYQVNVRLFSDSDGDGVGDINGLRQRLGYLELLGVDVLWLTHLSRAPVGGTGDELAPAVGDVHSLDLLVSEAHEHGLRLRLDMAIDRDRGSVPTLRKNWRATCGSG